MKKLLLLLGSVSAFLLVGCTPVEEVEKGNYKEGTYLGVAKVEGERPYAATAVIHVDEDGFIDSVFLDAAYTKDGVPTTKKVLGDEYGMKSTSANIGTIEGGAEWYEQANSLEEKIVEEQDLDWITWSEEDETKTDSVAGVTMSVDSLTEAVQDAMNKAK